MSWKGILETAAVYSFFFSHCLLEYAGGCVTLPPLFDSKSTIVHVVTLQHRYIAVLV